MIISDAILEGQSFRSSVLDLDELFRTLTHILSSALLRRASLYILYYIRMIELGLDGMLASLASSARHFGPRRMDTTKIFREMEPLIISVRTLKMQKTANFGGT